MIAEERGEAVIGLLLAALGIAVAWIGAGLPRGSGGVPGPGIFPTALGVLLTLTGTGLTITAWYRGATTGVDLLEPRAIIGTALIGAYVVAFEPLGFLPSTFLFLFVAFVAVGRVRWLPALVVSLIASAAMAVLFLEVLSVSLPTTLLG